MATYRQICDDLERERRLRQAAERDLRASKSLHQEAVIARDAAIREASALAAKLDRAEAEAAKMQAEIHRLTAKLSDAEGRASRAAIRGGR